MPKDQSTDNAIAQIIAAQAEAKEAKSAMEAIQAEVKKLHKETYLPLCMNKKDAEARYELAQAELKRLLRDNAHLVEALRGTK